MLGTLWEDTSGHVVAAADHSGDSSRTVLSELTVESSLHDATEFFEWNIFWLFWSGSEFLLEISKNFILEGRSG